jgi:hypothetical protein
MSPIVATPGTELATPAMPASPRLQTAVRGLLGCKPRPGGGQHCYYGGVVLVAVVMLIFLAAATLACVLHLRNRRRDVIARAEMPGTLSAVAPRDKRPERRGGNETLQPDV